jgi:hypothetical protein
MGRVSQKTPAAQGGSQSQLELESLRALAIEATKDTVLWLQANPSTERYLYVLGMQAQLGELDRIVTRQIEGRGTAKESRKRAQIERELLSLLEKAREVRGDIVGKHLARLKDSLATPGKDQTERPLPHSSSLMWQGIEIAIPGDPSAWRSCASEFKQLPDEETRIVGETKKERLLADCYFDPSPALGRATVFELREGPSEHLKARFEALAWLARRKLPRVNCGRAVRIPADAVAQFIERNTIPAKEERR